VRYASFRFRTLHPFQHPITQNSNNIRLDKYYSKDRIYGNFYRNTVFTGGPNIRPAFTVTNNYYVFNLQANETHTFSSKMLNEAIFSYSRIEGFADQKRNIHRFRSSRK